MRRVHFMGRWGPKLSSGGPISCTAHVPTLGSPQPTTHLQQLWVLIDPQKSFGTWLCGVPTSVADARTVGYLEVSDTYVATHL
jgi:hypothetical protein